MVNDKTHLYTGADLAKDRKFVDKTRNQQGFSRFSVAATNGLTTTADTSTTPATNIITKPQIGDPINDTYGTIGLVTQIIFLDVFGSTYNTMKIDGDVTFAFDKIPQGRHIAFTIDLLIDTVTPPTITLDPRVINPPTLPILTNGLRVVLKFEGVRDDVSTRFTYIGGTVTPDVVPVSFAFLRLSATQNADGPVIFDLNTIVGSNIISEGNGIFRLKNGQYQLAGHLEIQTNTVPGVLVSIWEKADDVGFTTGVTDVGTAGKIFTMDDTARESTQPLANAVINATTQDVFVRLKSVENPAEVQISNVESSAFITALVSVGTVGGGGGASPLTTKGDLFGFSTVDARVPAGANGDVLTAEFSESLGLKYAPRGGLSWKLPVRVVETTGFSANFPLIPEIIDGVTLVEGDRVLLTLELLGKNNGIYRVSGPAVANLVPTIRPDDFNSDVDMVSESFVAVEEGTVHKQTIFHLITPNPIIDNVTSQTWQVFGAAGSQTPWLQDIAAAGFDLNDLGVIQYRTNSTLGAANTAFTVFDGTNLRTNVPSTISHLWTVLNADILKIDNIEIKAFKKINMSSLPIINLQTPTLAADAANKGYVDGVAATRALDNLVSPILNVSIDVNARELNNVFRLTGVGTNQRIQSVAATGFEYRVNTGTEAHTFKTSTTTLLTISEAKILLGTALDAADKSFDNLGLLTFFTHNSFGSSTTAWIEKETLNLTFNTPSANGYIFRVALAQVMGLSVTNMNLDVPLDMSAKKITSLATPTAFTDAATKGYVDGVATGATGTQDASLWESSNQLTPSDRAWHTNSKGGDAGSSIPLAINEAFFVPLYVAKSVTLRAIALDVTSASAANVTVAIYDSVTGENYPNTLLDTSNAMFVLGTGLRERITFNEVLTPGLYWLLVRTSAGVSIRNWTFKSAVNVGYHGAIGATATPICGYRTTMNSSIPPNPANNEMTVIDTTTLVGVPAIFARFYL